MKYPTPISKLKQAKIDYLIIYLPKTLYKDFLNMINKAQ